MASEEVVAGNTSGAPSAKTQGKSATGKAELEGSADAADKTQAPQKVPLRPKDIPRKLKAGQRWNGRVAGLSLADYRELKWGMEAGWSQVKHRAPKYSVKQQLPILKAASTNTILPIQPHKSFDAINRAGCSWTMSYAGLVPWNVLERSPGPTEYKVKSTMDPRKHPTLSKSCGATFGRDTLAARDETSPAPGDYDVGAFEKSSVYKKKPKWTIEGRESWAPRSEAPGPGCGEYYYTHTTRLGKITPFKYTVAGKLEPSEIPMGERRTVKPGPDHYKPPGHIDCKNNHVAKHKPPVWSLSREPRGLL